MVANAVALGLYGTYLGHGNIEGVGEGEGALYDKGVDLLMY